MCSYWFDLQVLVIDAFKSIERGSGYEKRMGRSVRQIIRDMLSALINKMIYFSQSFKDWWVFGGFQRCISIKLSL